MSETHRHFWQPTNEPGRYACTECDETCASCIECRHPAKEPTT